MFGIALLLASMLAIRPARAQNRLPIFGAERLASAQNWSESDATFYPSTPGHNATVSFPANKWSALMGTLPLKGMDGAFSLHVRCRWTSDLAVTKGASCVLMFIDADHRDMPGAIGSPIPVAAGWQDVTVKASVPKGAATVRFDIDCGAGGALEIADYDLYLEDVDLSRAAAQGVPMPWLHVPGGSALPPTSPESAGASFADASPYAFDAAVWTKSPSYPIPTTRANKTPLNDVAASFQMAWTTDALYVRYHAHDPILNFKSKSRYERDCFEFFLMPTGHLKNGDHAGSADDLIAKEQYTVTRTPEGQTDSNADAITRVVPDGWEAILKIPLQTEARRIYPFNGLALTFNAVYQDANTLPQEHWLSFSARDQTNASWQDVSLYVPLVFQTEATVAYKPFWRSGDDVAYNVTPKFPGRINLVHSSATMENIDLWDKTPEARLAAYKEGDHDCFRVAFPNLARQRRVIFVLS